MPKNNKIRQRINNNNKDSNNNNRKKLTKINSKSYTYDSVEKNTIKDKDGRFWRPKSENEKDKELEDWCEQCSAFNRYGYFCIYNVWVFYQCRRLCNAFLYE